MSHLCVLSEAESEKRIGFRNVDESNEDFANLLQLRENQVHYVPCLDTYSACIISNKIWNDDQLMEKFCGSDQVAFYEQILTISDEAFLLLVLINSAARWKAEISLEHKKVSIVVVLH